MTDEPDRRTKQNLLWKRNMKLEKGRRRRRGINSFAKATLSPSRKKWHHCILCSKSCLSLTWRDGRHSPHVRIWGLFILEPQRRSTCLPRPPTPSQAKSAGFKITHRWAFKHAVMCEGCHFLTKWVDKTQGWQTCHGGGGERRMWNPETEVQKNKERATFEVKF